jgi:hypothetical protein
VAQAFEFGGDINKVGALSFAHLRRAGAMQHAVPVLTPTKSHDTSSIVPALAKSARAGHPQFHWGKKKVNTEHRKAGPPARR